MTQLERDILWYLSGSYELSRYELEALVGGNKRRLRRAVWYLLSKDQVDRCTNEHGGLSVNPGNKPFLYITMDGLKALEEEINK